MGLGGADNEALANDRIVAEARAALALLNALQAENEARNERLVAEASQSRAQIQENAFWKLHESMIGKRPKTSWEAYVATVLRDYLSDTTY